LLKQADIEPATTYNLLKQANSEPATTHNLLKQADSKPATAAIYSSKQPAQSNNTSQRFFNNRGIAGWLSFLK
jgi:hypothetical protein